MSLPRAWYIKLICAWAIIAVSLIFCWSWITASAINRQAFDQIEMGMSEKEVSEILGGPPRNEDANNPKLHFTRTRGEPWQIWRAKHFAIAVYYDSKGKGVVQKMCVQDHPESWRSVCLGRDGQEVEQSWTAPRFHKDTLIDEILYTLGLQSHSGSTPR